MGTRAYLTTAGVLVPTKDKAGPGHSQVDIPYGKQEQLAFINEMVAKAAQGGHVVTDQVAQPEPQYEAHARRNAVIPEGGQCPMCSRPKDVAERAARKLREGDQVDAVVELMDELVEPFSFERIQAGLDTRRAELGQ